jgi:hypothetical protein
MTIPRPSPSRSRAKSFSQLDIPYASNHLSELLIQEGVFLGGSSVGKGLKHAARYHLHQRVLPPDFYNLPGALDLEPEASIFSRRYIKRSWVRGTSQNRVYPNQQITILTLRDSYKLTKNHQI